MREKGKYYRITDDEYKVNFVNESGRVMWRVCVCERFFFCVRKNNRYFTGEKLCYLAKFIVYLLYARSHFIQNFFFFTDASEEKLIQFYTAHTSSLIL